LAVVTGLVLLFASTRLHGQEPPVQGPPLRVNVNRVSVGVTVSDAHGRFVHDLSRSDFQIFDNGVEQPIADFLSVEEPAQVLLLIEGGPSVLFFAKGHVLAADQMVASLASDDRVAIATYTKGARERRRFHGGQDRSKDRVTRNQFCPGLRRAEFVLERRGGGW
jgi:hypothetical protein